MLEKSPIFSPIQIVASIEAVLGLQLNFLPKSW